LQLILTDVVVSRGLGNVTKTQKLGFADHNVQPLDILKP